MNSFRILSAQRSTFNLDIWISGSFGPLVACPDYQDSASYSHGPLDFVPVEARPTRLLSSAWWSKGNVRASVCFSCFGKLLLCEFHVDYQPFPINEIDIRVVEPLLLTVTCILIGMPSCGAVVNVNQLCELDAYNIFFWKLILFTVWLTSRISRNLTCPKHSLLSFSSFLKRTNKFYILVIP